MIKEYYLKAQIRQPATNEFFFGVKPPDDFPFGRVELALVNRNRPKGDDIISLKGVAVYTNHFNRPPIHYFVAGANIKQRDGKIEWVTSEKFSDAQKDRAIFIVRHG